MNHNPHPLQLIGALVLDYLRWTQLTPMILGWAVAIALLLAMFVVGHGDAAGTLIEGVVEWVISLPLVGPPVLAWMEAQAEQGSLHLDTEDFKSAALTAWGVASLAFMAMAWLAGLLFGPFKPWSLPRKLGLAVLGCLLMVGGFMALYFFDRDSWNDPLPKVLMVAAGLGFLLFIVTAWCLSISHLLGMMAEALRKADFRKAGTERRAI